MVEFECALAEIQHLVVRHGSNPCSQMLDGCDDTLRVRFSGFV